MAKKKTTGGEDNDLVIRNLIELQELIKHSIAVQLYLEGMTQEDIGKNLGVAKEKVVGMVKGIKKRKGNPKGGKVVTADESQA